MFKPSEIWEQTLPMVQGEKSVVFFSATGDMMKLDSALQVSAERGQHVAPLDWVLEAGLQPEAQS